MAGRDAWNQGRPDDLAAFFAPNGDLIAADGTHLTDRAAIAEYYRQALSGPYGSLRLLNFKLLGSCQISAGVSVIDGTWEVHAPAGAARASAAVASCDSLGAAHSRAFGGRNAKTARRDDDRSKARGLHGAAARDGCGRRSLARSGGGRWRHDTSGAGKGHQQNCAPARHVILDRAAGLQELRGLPRPTASMKGR